MNPASKALSLSLAFHSLMALFAALMINMFHTPQNTFALPLKKITLVSLSAPSPVMAPPSVQAPQPHTEAPQKAMRPTVQEPIRKHVIRDIPPVPKKAASDTAPTPVFASLSPSSSVDNKPSSLPAPAAGSPAPAAKAAPKVDISAEKRSFFAHLRSKIQQNLRYPSAARRRGMEGDVNVRFVLENGGAIRNISVSQGESIFHEAAKIAVASASGIAIPETLSDTFPTEIQLTLEFRLN